MGFSYKKNCGRLPFGEVPAAVLFRFSFPTKPIRFLFCSGGQFFFLQIGTIYRFNRFNFFESFYLCACAAVLAWNIRNTPVCSISFVRL